MIHLDTHLVAWLYEGRSQLIPKTVADLLEENDLVISPMVELELEYLYEIGRAEVGSATVIEDLRGRIGLVRSDAPFSTVIDQARGLTWTRDPFDRLIVATAMADSAPLITRDEHILDHFGGARWDGVVQHRSVKRRPVKRRPRTQRP